MLVIFVLLVPPMLLVLMLSMERVERPLRDETIGERVIAALDQARVEEVETLVSSNTAVPVERYWRRIRRRWDVLTSR
jgi:hypothetical protein